MKTKTIWTVGHSTHPIEEFIAMLQSFGIQGVADIRSLPGSNKYPQFNKEALELSLPAAGIVYEHFKELGGLRKPLPAWMGCYTYHGNRKIRTSSIYKPCENC